MCENVSYRIYPSLLNGYQRLLDWREAAEEPWNRDGEGGYKVMPDDMYASLEADLIDSVNRTPRQAAEAADLGTAFNEAVDCAAQCRASVNPYCEVSREVDGWRCRINGFDFLIDGALVEQTADAFRGSLSQHYVEAVLDTSFGPVMLYGYIDEWRGGHMADIKTTKSYEFGKYGRGWQHRLYPWCAVASGQADKVEDFTYYVVEWSGRKGARTAKGVTEETYVCDHAADEQALREICESFIGWLESRRRFIEDRRVFGGENPDGFRGVPVDREELSAFLFGENSLNI